MDSYDDENNDKPQRYSKVKNSKVGRIVEKVPPAVWPGVFTTGTIFLALLAIANAAQHNWETAGLCIFSAAVLDAFDGGVARITHSETKFGALFDSMADLISFGMVPAIVIMLWTYDSLGELALVTPFIYVFCTAIRLTWFTISESSKSDYTGLPSPISALLLTSSVWLIETTNFQVEAEYIPIFRSSIAATCILLGLLMISKINFSRIGFLRSPELKPLSLLTWISLIAAIFILIYINPPLAIFGMSLGYISIGLAQTASNILFKRKSTKT